MPSGVTIRFSRGVAKIASIPELKDNPAWQAAFAARCKDCRFYEIIEETLESGFEHHYIVLEDNSGAIRGLQPVFFVQQNLVEGVPALKSAVDAIRKTSPRFLTMRVLMVGCAAGHSDLGACFPEDVGWVAEALSETLKIYARSGGASLIVLKDFPAGYRGTLRVLESAGYTRVPSMPMTQLKLRYANFEDYIASLGSVTRKDLRRKFRKIANAAPIELQVVTDVAPYVEEIYPLYLQVHERSKLKFERLTKDYFCELGRRMPDRARFFIWRQLGKAIAFSLCLIHERTIYDDYLGLDYRVALDLHLYFYTFRDIISWAIENGMETYCSSPLNYQPKLHLRCELYPLDLYVMHTSSVLNPIFGPALKLLGPTRHDPVLPRFRNADALR